MQEIIISVHVPKTGGTSFQEILKEVYEDSFLGDNNWSSLPDAINGQALTGTDDEIRKALSGVKCIHGHFQAQKYKRLSEIEGIRPIFVTWLRDPVERAASTYYYLRRKPATYSEDETPPWERDAKAMTAEDFLTQTNYGRNRQSAQLRNVPIESFNFVGVTDQYQKSIEIFAKMFSPQRDLSTIPVARKNSDRQGDRYDLPDHVRQSLMDGNAQDFSFYQYAQKWVERVHRQMAEAHMSTPPVGMS